MGSRKKTISQKAPTPTDELGRIVREQRKSLGLTQHDLALNSGVGLAFLYQLEHGKPTVRIDKVLAVFRTLGIAITFRLARPDHPAGTIADELPRPEP